MSDSCRDSTDFFRAFLSGRATYVWLFRDFDFHLEQCSAENRPTFRQVWSAEQGQIFSLGLNGEWARKLEYESACRNSEIVKVLENF